MKVGLQIATFNWAGSPENIGARLADVARTAEDAGFDSIWVMDHFFQLEGMIGPADDPMLEAYSTMSYLAGVTRRARLGTLVTGVVYRHPGLLVKAATNLDVLSGGRAYLGIGAAWFEREAVGLGLPFPSISERFERLEETLQIAKRMWTGDRTPYEGKHYRLAEPICSPSPLSKPHPPILIGGMGERKTLRLVAQYADACNLFAQAGVDELARKLDVLKRHCEDVGRPYEQIERTVLSIVWLAPGVMTPAQVVESCRKLADIGIQHVIFSMPNHHEIAPLELVGREVIPAVSGF